MQIDKSEKENLGELLIESVSISSLTDIALEVSDIALDTILDEGILKEIPVFGWLAKAYSTYHGITDKMFLKKVGLFLYGVSQASEKERRNFTNKLDGDPKFRRKVGENLLLLIDKHERLEKSLLLGKIMAKVMEGKCSNEDFLRLSAAIDKALVEDLEDLNKNHENISNMTEDVKQSLYKSHLLNMELEGYSLDPVVEIEATYKINTLGEKLIKFAFSSD